ncbi:MAG: ribonuclease R [Sphingobacteriales bacterium]
MSRKKSKKSNSPINAILQESILDVLEGSQKALNFKQISAAIGIDDKEQRQVVLDVLLREVKKGRVDEIERGKFQVKHSKKRYEGVVDMATNGSAYIICDAFEQDVMIQPKYVGNALHDDRVAFILHAKEKQGTRVKGQIVAVLERTKTEYTGQLSVSKNYAFLIADSRKMPRDIFIPTSGLNGGNDGDKVLVEITEWPKDAKNPIGKVKKVFGTPGEHSAEMESIIFDNGFDSVFPEEVEREAAAIPDTIPEKALKDRKDLRKTLTLTIDPVDAKDFDDAISFKKLEDNRYEIGIHIADVSHYVKPGTELDKEAYKRATSVYLVDRVLPMLPEKLSNNVCSLRPNEDKLCFSALFELDGEGQVLKEWYGRTVIHSDHRFAYLEVQEILDAKKGKFSEELTTLNSIAHNLRKKRFAEGSISFETTEVKFKLDKDMKPVEVYVKERVDAHKLVEDFMLLANRRVAKFIGDKKKKNDQTFVYRSHDLPKEEAMVNFARFAYQFGHRINTNTIEENITTLNAMMEKIVGEKEQNILSSMAARTMSKAVYTTEKTSHFGLGFEFYTHFTSPIRRYPDVMVHRLLQHYLDGGKSVEAEKLEKNCQHCTSQEIKATAAERQSIKFKQAEYLVNEVGEVFDGVISHVTEWGIYVELNANKCEGMIKVSDLEDDFYLLDADNFCIVGQRKKKKFKIGDEITIMIDRVDLIKRQIDFTLVK